MTPARATPAAGEAELLARLRPLAYALCRDVSWPGATRDDVRQEAMIGALTGIRTWRPDGSASLPSLVRLAVRRQLWTAIKTANRDKHRPLNESVRSEVTDEGTRLELLDLVDDQRADVHRNAAGRETLAQVVACIHGMTEVEQTAVLGVAAGVPYRQLGAPKAIDNALQRARRKITAAVDLEEAA